MMNNKKVLGKTFNFFCLGSFCEVSRIGTCTLLIFKKKIGKAKLASNGIAIRVISKLPTYLRDLEIPYFNNL